MVEISTVVVLVVDLLPLCVIPILSLGQFLLMLVLLRREETLAVDQEVRQGQLEF